MFDNKGTTSRVNTLLQRAAISEPVPPAKSMNEGTPLLLQEENPPVAPEESCGACCSRDCCCTATQVGAGLLGVGVAFFAPWGANMLGVLKTNMAININIAEAIVGGIGSCYGLTVGHRH